MSQDITPPEGYYWEQPDAMLLGCERCGKDVRAETVDLHERRCITEHELRVSGENRRTGIPYDLPVEELPFDMGDGRTVIESDFRTDPVVGRVGSYSIRFEYEVCEGCARVGTMIESVDTLTDEGRYKCEMCGFEQ